MSGLTCGDRGQEKLGDHLCESPADHPDPKQRELVTYADGRAAAVIRNEGGKTVFAGPKGTGEITVDGLSPAAIALTRTMAGGEIGDCAARGAGGGSFSMLQTVYDGSPVVWNASHLAALHRALGQSNGQSGNAFFCSNRENAGALAVNNDVLHRPALLSAIDALANHRDKFSELDDVHHRAMLPSLRAAAGVPESQSPWDQVKGVAGYLFGGLFVFIVGGAGAHFLTEWLKKLGGPKDPPCGGVGRSADQTAQATVTPPESKSPEAKREGGPSLDDVVIGSFLGIGSVFGGAALMGKVLSTRVPGFVPVGALGVGLPLFIEVTSEDGWKRPIWEGEKKGPRS